MAVDMQFADDQRAEMARKSERESQSKRGSPIPLNDCYGFEIGRSELCGEAMIKNAVASCERCGGPILRGSEKTAQLRHCSHACKSAATRIIKPEALREAAMSGMTVMAMSRRFEVNPATVRKWLETDGLLRDWSRRRFKKCAA